MKIFICNRSINNDETENFIQKLLNYSNNSVAILRQTEHTEKWKIDVDIKMRESDFILFTLGVDTFESDQIIWEYAKSKELNKRIFGLKLSTASNNSLLFCQGFQVFDNEKQLYDYMKIVFEEDRQLLLEQYKIMVGSTEKVTGQRLKVNNFFLTITSTVISVAFFIGKSFNFALIGTLGMVLFTIFAIIISISWEKLINSYGKLNEGKFILIDKIEKLLRTNMFEDEWRILIHNIKYESNTKTEIMVIKYFRNFIIFIGIIEVSYGIYLIYPYIQNWILCH